MSVYGIEKRLKTIKTRGDW